jgi:hypothetical protein
MEGVVIGKRGSRLRSSATDKALGGRASRDGPRYLPAASSCGRPSRPGAAWGELALG